MKLFAFLFVTLLGCQASGQSYSQQQKNAEAFTKLYGYVKYFHPSDEAASINWDQFAIYGVNVALQAKSDKELIAALNSMFKPIAPTVQIGTSLKFDETIITPPNKESYKPVFWFHNGVGLSDNPIYSSVRLNRPEQKRDNPSQTFAPFTQSINASGLVGKEIKLKGKMKANVSPAGSGHFWLRIDKDKGKGFFYNMDDKPVTKNEWGIYEFTGKVDPDAKAIFFGGFLKGKGIIWADDIQLYVRGNSTEEWESVQINNGDFETLNNNHPEGWYAGPVEGYKYDVNPVENNNVLEISSTPHDGGLPTGNIITSIDYKYPPNLGSIVHKKLTGNIEAIIPIVLYGTESQTYPVVNAEQLTALKNSISSFAKDHNTGSSLAVRLADVAIAWNIFKHFFPYWEDASKTPDAILDEALSKAFLDKTPLDFKETLLKTTEPLNDGHIWVNLKGDTTNSFMLPLKLGWVENKVVVEAVLDSTISNIKPGDIIEKIDGQNAVDLYKMKANLISGSPQWKSYKAISNLPSGSNNTKANISLLRNGKTIESTLYRNMRAYNYHTAVNNLRKASGKIADDIYYLDLNNITKDSIDKWSDELAQAKGVICDLRGYPKGNHNLINYLLTTGEDTKWMFTPKTAYPDQQKIEFKEYGWNMQPKAPHIKGKVIFITDGRAISYAESYMGFIKDFKLATIIGQPTAGTNGNVNPFSLPGGYSISWTGMMVKNHDGSKHHIKGVVPDISLERTIKGVAEGKDEFYEKALQLINEEK